MYLSISIMEKYWENTTFFGADAAYVTDETKYLTFHMTRLNYFQPHIVITSGTTLYEYFLNFT